MVDHNVTATLGAGARFYAPTWDDYPRLENRIAYESDGTTILFDVNGGLRERADWEIAALNSPHPGYVYNGIGYPNTGAWTFVFPELRNITHWLAVHEGRSAPVTLYYSTNTTNGLDGTWTSVESLDYVEPNTMINKLRSLPSAVNLVNVRALKTTHPVTAGLFFDSGGDYHKVHFYGTKAQSSRLVFWEPDWDEECNTQFWNWGNFSAGPTVKRFRVKNISQDKRSVGTIISAQNKAGDAYDDGQYFSFSTNGTSYSTTLNIGNLETNQVSSTLYIKLDIPVTVANRYISARIIAHPTTWYQWKQDTTAILTATGSLAVPSRYVTWNAQATLTAGLVITDGALYRNSGQYRDSKVYRPSGIVMTWAGQAALTASLGGSIYLDEYMDQYGFSGLYAEGYNTVKRTTATLTASVLGDNYPDKYADAYGTTGLSAAT
jgi:hypothetical protein